MFVIFTPYLLSQVAELAEQAGQSDEVILGAFLHDFGQTFSLDHIETHSNSKALISVGIYIRI
jgi:predicted HD phosphohydrolase